MSDLLEYKCPQCGGVLSFDSHSQQMVCPFCDASFSIESLKAKDDILNDDLPSSQEPKWDMPSSEWQTGEQENMVIYSCKSCAGEIVGDKTLGSTNCPYCGNNVVMTGQFSGTLRPDVVIPFKLDSETAKAKLKAHYNGKKFLPKVFKDQNHIEEIKGIYVPFWLFDCDADAHIRYNATKSRSWSDSKYNYVETSHFTVTRSGEIAFDRVPVDGSSKMPDDLMESVEPFDYKDLVDFQTAYLAGYLADKYDVDAKASVQRANERIRKSTESAFAESVTGYESVTPQASNISTKQGGIRYALLPVWILNTEWNNEKFVFAMNGQTGKIVGDLPIDKGAVRAWFIKIFVPVSAAVFVITNFIL